MTDPVIIYQTDPDSKAIIKVLETRIESLMQENEELLNQIGHLQRQRTELHNLYRKIYIENLAPRIDKMIEELTKTL